MKTLSIDIETFSSVDLTKAGVYKYASSPDFEILLFGYSVDGGDVRVVDLTAGEIIPADVLDALTDDSVIKTAHNSNFERVCLSRYLSDLGVSLDPFHDAHPLSTECARFLNPAGWHCTMVWTAYMGLPLSLADTGAVLGLERQKLSEGKDLIRYFCKPCEPTKTNGGRTRNRPADAPEKWELFKSYNLRDVETELEIEKRLSKFPVPEDVWDQYHIDQEINDRGIAIDEALVENAIRMDARSRAELTEMMQKLTNLDNPNSVQQMKQWLINNGMEIDSLGKKQVQALLQDAPPQLREVLLLRQQLARSSVKKYMVSPATSATMYRFCTRLVAARSPVVTRCACRRLWSPYPVVAIPKRTLSMYFYPEHPMYRLVDGVLTAVSQMAYEAQVAASTAQATAEAARADFKRVIRIDNDGLHVGDNQSSGEVLIDSESVNVVMNGNKYSRFAGNYVQFGNYQLRRTTDGGLAFKITDI